MDMPSNPMIAFALLISILSVHLVVACVATSIIVHSLGVRLSARRRRQLIHAAFSIALFTSCLHLSAFDKGQAVDRSWTKRPRAETPPVNEWDSKSQPLHLRGTEHLVPAGCASEKDLSKLPSSATSAEFNRGGASSVFSRNAGTLLFLDATFSSFSNQWRTAAGVRIHHL